METEIWKEIPEYEGKYDVSNYGRVKSLSRIIMRSGKYPFLSKELMLKQSVHSDGYLGVCLGNKNGRKSIKTHQLVAMAFLGHKRCSFRIVVDHVDNNCLNNKLENLQLITHRDNSIKDRVINHKYSGVTFEKRRKKWVGRISLNNKHYTTTYFKDEEEAYLEYIGLRNKLGVDLPIRFELSKYGMVETLNINKDNIEVKITDGFKGDYESTMRIGETIWKHYNQYRNVILAKKSNDFCHYIFSK